LVEHIFIYVVGRKLADASGGRGGPIERPARCAAREQSRAASLRTPGGSGISDVGRWPPLRPPPLAVFGTTATVTANLVGDRPPEGRIPSAHQHINKHSRHGDPFRRTNFQLPKFGEGKKTSMAEETQRCMWWPSSVNGQPISLSYGERNDIKRRRTRPWRFRVDELEEITGAPEIRVSCETSVFSRVAYAYRGLRCAQEHVLDRLSFNRKDQPAMMTCCNVNARTGRTQFPRPGFAN
jgi:hypothetical protein